MSQGYLIPLTAAGALGGTLLVSGTEEIKKGAQEERDAQAIVVKAGDASQEQLRQQEINKACAKKAAGWAVAATGEAIALPAQALTLLLLGAVGYKKLDEMDRRAVRNFLLENLKRHCLDPDGNPLDRAPTQILIENDAQFRKAISADPELRAVIVKDPELGKIFVEKEQEVLRKNLLQELKSYCSDPDDYPLDRGPIKACIESDASFRNAISDDPQLRAGILRDRKLGKVFLTKEREDRKPGTHPRIYDDKRDGQQL